MGVPSRLTEMQMKFCEILIFGSVDGPVSGTEAAIQAGYAADSSRVRASELQNIDLYPKTVAYLTELRKEKLRKYSVNYENHVARLGTLGSKSERKGNMMSAIRAEELRGKASGLYINQTEIRTGKLDDLPTEELKRRMKIIYDEEAKLKEAKKLLHATMKSLPSSSRKTKVSSSDPQKSESHPHPDHKKQTT
jgi:phage terminase small subunit